MIYRSHRIIYMNNQRRRKSIRLTGYDYSQAGYYFVTICAYQRKNLFGNISDRTMQLNRYGEIVAEKYQWLSHQYIYVNLDEWIIMPNHFHGIIVIADKSRDRSKRKPLGRLIGAFKTVSAKQINQIRNTPGAKVWQRNYYEHIIRNQSALNKIREYISHNPVSWENDRLHPNNPSKW